jgi:hypothetical protein
MGRFRRMMPATLLATGAAAVVLTACVDNESSLFVQGVLAPLPPDCTVVAEPNAMTIGAGILDVAMSNEYRAWLLVGNQLTARGRKQQVRTETARVTLRGAEIRLETAEGGEIGAYTVPGTGFVHISRSEEPGFGAFLATLIPGDYGSALGATTRAAGFLARQTVVANVRVFGSTLGGEEIESAELAYPIEICNGCSIVYPVDAIDWSNRSCSLGAADDALLPCFPGQGPIDCRHCAGTVALCRTLPDLQGDP